MYSHVFQCLDLFCLYNYFACMFVCTLCVFLRDAEGARLPGVMGGFDTYVGARN